MRHPRCTICKNTNWSNIDVILNQNKKVSIFQLAKEFKVSYTALLNHYHKDHHKERNDRSARRKVELENLSTELSQRINQSRNPIDAQRFTQAYTSIQEEITKLEMQEQGKLTLPNIQTLVEVYRRVTDNVKEEVNNLVIKTKDMIEICDRVKLAERKMMIQHSAFFDDANEKIKQIEDLLKQVKDVLEFIFDHTKKAVQ